MQEGRPALKPCVVLAICTSQKTLRCFPDRLLTPPYTTEPGVRGIYWKIYLTFIITSVLAAGVTLAYAVLYRQISNETNNLIAPTEGCCSTSR